MDLSTTLLMPDVKEKLAISDDGWVHSLSFSSDGKALAVYAGRPKFWRLPEMHVLPLFPELRDLQGTIIEGQPSMFSPDGKFFAYLRNLGEIVIVNIDNKTTTRINCQCLSFTFSPDSSKLTTVGAFVAGSSPIEIWNPVTGERIR